jgi:hypothetical protein
LPKQTEIGKRGDPGVARKMGISASLLAELSARHQEREPFLIAVNAPETKGALLALCVECGLHP